MNRIFITGDTHGLMDFEKLKRFSASNDLVREDYIIIAGDCGVVWSKELLNEYMAEFENIGATILFIDGNHENFDMLKLYPVTTFCGGKVHKTSDNIYHLCRGEIFTLCGKTFLALGGGESNDVDYRREHKSWWKDERISREDVDNAIKNLALNNNSVDYVISHMPPTKLLKVIENELTCCGEELAWYMIPKLQPRISNDYLQEVIEQVSFEKCFFGHVHLDMSFGKFVCVYDKVIELK